jgi:hypothetical protein
LIHVVRLARTATVILIPTELGRLAVAPASEEALLDALSRAARARHRLEELARYAPPVEVEAPPPLPATPIVDADDGDDDAIETDPQPATAGPAPRVMTGIERAMLEAQRARELADAEMTRLAAEAAAAMPDPVEPPAEDRPRAIETPARGRRLPWGRGPHDEPGGLPAEAAVDPDVQPEADPVPVSEPEPLPEPEPLNEPKPDARPERRGARRSRLGVPRPSTAFALLPILGAGAVWGVATLSARLPEVSTDLAKLAALALVFSGPATSLGAIVARAWWPRLVGVVVAGGLVASAFIGRALLCPLN